MGYIHENRTQKASMKFNRTIRPNRILLYFLAFFSLNNLCFGQVSDLGSWNILNLKYKFDEKWSVFGEVQLRSLKFYDHFHYYEYKIAVNYQILPNVNLTLGTGDYNTYKEGGSFITPKNNDEFRIWPQISLSQSIGKFKVEHRYRTELRFTTIGYRNRFRYRLGISLPFGNEKHGYKPLLLSASNELFFTDKEPYFERNRVLISVGFRMSKRISVQLGYLNQFDYRINDETGKDFIQLGLNIELSKKTDKNQQPFLKETGSM
jgi:hypothetical protein